MNREDIDKRASEYARHQVNPLKNINHTQVGLAMYANDVAVAFEAGAEWMQEQKQAEIDELNNKVSELTEALDASHVFCEGVKEHYIKKACEWAEEWFSNGEEWMRRTSFIDGIKEELTNAMKGE